MNKQELINRIKTFSELNPNYPCAINRTPNIIHAIEQLDEPEKVKVSAFVAEWFERNKYILDQAILEYMFEEYESDQSEFGKWFDNKDSKPIETLVRMLDGYEVEEEPKWVVKINNMYFLNWGEDGTCPTFVIDDAPGTKEQAEKYESELEAKSVAEIFSGTVEKV